MDGVENNKHREIWVNNLRIAYLPHPDATPESELSVLANVYAYLIKSHHGKKAAKPAQLRTGDAKSSMRRKEAEMP
jgi:hypothetical protein